MVRRSETVTGRAITEQNQHGTAGKILDSQHYHFVVKTFCRADQGVLQNMRFLLFFTVFTLIYSTMHLYGFVKAKNALSFGPGISIGLGLFLVLMVFSPFLVHLFQGKKFEVLPTVVAYVGYTWMAFLFLFVCISLAMDVCKGISYIIGFLLKGDGQRFLLSTTLIFWVNITLAILITCYGYVEANNIRTERITIQSPKIPAKAGKVTIVQVSDIHLGLMVREKRLEMILKAVREANPDILVSTGDLVDEQVNHIEAIVQRFRSITPAYGKYAVTGNHEFYGGLDQAVNLMKRAGFRLLRGEVIKIPGLLNIAGIDDPAGKSFGIMKGITEKQLLSTLPKESFTLLLKHRPMFDKAAAGLFDLQISGHSHKGQIFPFSLIIKLLYPVDSGLFRLTNNALLYVSRGAGTWGPPIRFLAPPEIAVFTIVHGPLEVSETE